MFNILFVHNTKKAEPDMLGKLYRRSPQLRDSKDLDGVNLYQVDVLSLQRKIKKVLRETYDSIYFDMDSLSLNQMWEIVQKFPKARITQFSIKNPTAPYKTIVAPNQLSIMRRKRRNDQTDNNE